MEQFDCFNMSKMTSERAFELEWLETNVLGSYSSSTISGSHSRKYHGLLVCKLAGVPDKYLILNKFEDQLQINNSHYQLSAHHYRNLLLDNNLYYLKTFKALPNPCWQYQFNSLTLVKELLLIFEENLVISRYTLKGSGNAKCKLLLRPLFTLRNFHQLHLENQHLDRNYQTIKGGFSYTPYFGLPEIFTQVDLSYSLIPDPLWYKNLIYFREKERGYNFEEDLFTPTLIAIELEPDSELYCSCGLTLQDPLLLKERWSNELKRRNKLSSCFEKTTPLQQSLHRAANSFLVKNPHNSNLPAVTAGYHWFIEWGRDAMIALPGLTLFSNQETIAFQILQTFGNHLNQGLIPNYLGLDGANAYNTVDASLWFVWALQQYQLKTLDSTTVISVFWPIIKQIFNSYRSGTLNQIKMHDNGLIYAGNKDTNLTWMDARINNIPVTPRYGYPVEINALWFNLLNVAFKMAEASNDQLKIELSHLITLTKKSFQKVFWYEKEGYLYDFVNEQETNSDIRPNQIFAVSMPYSPLTLEMAASVVKIVKQHLLTPYGLRTLSPDDQGYCKTYQGNQNERDQAYHNGTIWPWLIGHFTEAIIKTSSNKNKVAEVIETILKSIEQHLSEYGIGSIAEIFSAESPYLPNGCISQAWSIAELLRTTYLLGKPIKCIK